MGVNHGVIGAHYSLLSASASTVLFAIVSLIFLLGRRSLTPWTGGSRYDARARRPPLIRGILFGVVGMT